MLKEKYLFLNACIGKEVKLKINELRIHLKNIGKKLQIKSKESRKKIMTRTEVNETEQK